MRFLELLAGLASKLLDPLTGASAKKTLCCGVLMHDLWMHKADCPLFAAAVERVKANGGRDVLPAYGDKGGLCPECGFPTGHYGIYTVGERCTWCGYVERRGRRGDQS
jgi:hypothetical protein